MSWRPAGDRWGRSLPSPPLLRYPADAMTRRLMILMIALIVGLGAPAWAGFDEGAAAYKRGDYETAFREMKPLAEQGDAAAQLLLGVMYSQGQGVSQDETEAASWWRKAAKQGDALAQFNLGVMYDLGRGVSQDSAEAVRWYRDGGYESTRPAQGLNQKLLGLKEQ